MSSLRKSTGLLLFCSLAIMLTHAQTISRVSATAGTTAGGGALDIMGSGLASSTAVTVKGNAATVTSALADGSRLTATLPSGTAGAADVVVGTVTLTGGYTYLDPATISFADDFNGGSLSNWTASPLGLLGNWSASNHAADYNGGGHTQIYAGSSSWADYTVEAKFQLFSGNNYPGGLRGRVNLSTGTSYAAWLYPGSSQIKLFRTGGWNIDSPGLVMLQQATVSSMAANVFHRLDLSFSGAQITVSYDGTVVITATDSTLSAGAIALDVSNQHIQFEDVLVTHPVVDTTPPTVSMAAPAAGATVSGTVSVTASASDDVGVAGVQFLLDGAALGAEVTVAPYTVSWNTAGSSNGAHTLSARARDAAGNTATAANVSVTVSNSAAGPPTITRVSATSGSTSGSTSGGGQLDVIGANLTGATVTIGAKAAPALSGLADGSRITVSIPAGSAGSADVVVSSSSGQATLAGGYTYLDPAAILFVDDFNSGSLGNWTASPLGLFGNWSASNHAADYNGGGHTQIYAGSSSWSDYTVETKFQLFSGSNYPGGLRGRVNLSTGTSYAAWLYPGSSQIKLFRTGGWSIDSPGLVLLQQATVSGMAANVFHRLDLSFSGAQIAVSYDGAVVITATDSTLSAGATALDVSNQHIQFEDVLVTHPAVDTTPPTVAITAPTAGATVAGTISVTASASDDGSVAGVQFLLDGVAFGAEVTVAPYTVSWNTAGSSNGTHTLSARARDAAGNTATAANVSVTAAQPTVTGLSLSPSSFSLGFVGGQQALTLTATYSDGSTKDMTSSAGYSSNNAAAATVNGSGIVTAVSNGNAAITATLGASSANATVAVSLSRAVLERISPPYGAASGGTRMDVIGHNLSGSATVTLAGAPANFVSALPDGSQMTVTTPSGTIGGADVVVSNTTGAARLGMGYRYLDPATILFADDFNLASLANWTASPIGFFGNWSASGDLADYNGGGHTQIFAGSQAWTNYSVQTRFQIFSVANFPGGLRGRVNLNSGVAYEAWLLPASAQIKLYRVGGWNIDSGGLALLGQANVPYISPDQFHTLQMVFNGAQITILLDGPAVLQATDAALASGGIALDVSSQHIQFDDVMVTTIPADTVPPAISITAPAGGTVSGTTTISATASDNVGVAGVQFLLDGSFLGVEQTMPPYSISWATANAVNGAHVLTAMARDASGNIATSAPVTVTVANTFDPTQAGQWTAPFNWPIVAINLAVLKTGEVISWDGPPANGGSSVTLWNPSGGTFSSVPNSASNMFCDGQTFLNDGRMLTAGGHADWGVGIRNSDIYDPVTRLWTSMAPMNFPRWYPTLTTLPDGRVLAVSGSDRCEACPVPTPEIFDPRTNTWTAFPNAPLSLPLYPFMFVLPDGRVLEAGSVSGTAVTEALDLSKMQWTVVDPNVVDGHSAVMYQPGKIMKSGTGSVPGNGNVPAQPTTVVLDMNQPNPKWVQTASMNFPRAYQNMTILPDGNVVVTGGETTLDGQNYANAVLPAELWSPTTQTWTTMAPEQNGRLYHSTAVLLLDGRVLVAGSGRAGTAPQLNAEIYSPPYLFRGPRPVIGSAPAEVAYGSAFAVNTPDAASISSVSLIGLSAATHGFNNGQNFENLVFSHASGVLTVTAPANANLAPPGQYALFIVNGNGVPSVASVMQLP
ncbi:MAG TPA: Ig-like domain-containing protein [Candidatus Saccharimonadales bacterium]|nr:Ig-like domain-containing protein [Candidatus Saccharimonadales bacterium]